MKRNSPIGNLVASVGATAVLLYLLKTPSPKIVLLPFLFCSLSMMGQGIAQLLGKEKLARVFYKCFVAGLALFWFGFLAVAGYTSIRDKTFGMLILLIPFFLIGIFVFKNKLLGKKTKQEASPFRFDQVMSAILVSLVLLAGIWLLVLGFQRGELMLAFMGAFFLGGGGAFVMGALTLRGMFDKAKVDVLGLYMGIVIALFGIGFGVMLLTSSRSAGLWILVPLLMAVVGVLQILKCIKNRK
jgi:hypothetical protein